VSYPHQVIINDICKVISWIFIGFQYHGVALVLRDVVNEISVHQVVEGFAAVAELKSDAIFVILGNLLCDLLWSEISEEKLKKIKGNIGNFNFTCIYCRILGSVSILSPLF
jgi:hypothetical protein